MTATDPWAPQPTWSNIIDIPQIYHARSCDLKDYPQQRAISIRQLEVLGNLIENVLSKKHYPKYIYDDKKGKMRVVGQLTKLNISMYEINEHFIKPLTNKCSYVEMIGSNTQDPHFFVSHYWGTPFFDTLRMLKLHAKHRGLSETDNYYWICTFANNQHNVELDINDMDYLKTPFARALLSGVCEGTVMLLDEARATPFSRMWCVFELYITTVVSRHRFKRLRGLLFDIATIIPARECKNALEELNQRCAGILLEKSEFDSDGEIKDNGFRKDIPYTDNVVESRRAWFPARVSKLGFLVDVREGRASNDGDRKWILGIIKG